MKTPEIQRSATSRVPSFTRSHLLLALLGCFSICIPFLAVEITPVTDIPQQLAQIPLFFDTVAGRAPDLRIQWLSPNKLSYPVLAVSSLFFEPLAAARASLVLIALIWVVAIFWLAARRDRPTTHAVLACVFLFNLAFGLGFLNFILGLGAFAYWFLTVERKPEQEHQWLRSLGPTPRCPPMRNFFTVAP